MIASHFSKFLSSHHQPASPEFSDLVEQLCLAVDSGSSCLHLTDLSGDTPVDFQSVLACDGEQSAVASPGGNAPLILTPENKLYLQRYYLHEQAIHNFARTRANMPPRELGDAALTRVDELFEGIEGNDQAKAALCALQNQLSIITGGPGTGKTTTVLKILMLLRERGDYKDKHECLLLAPTGKAADRLRQSILSGLAKLKVNPEDFPTETSTIHRALGYQPGSIEFRHDEDYPLAAKIVVVDESSMVDLPLMARLLRAIPTDAKVILLGDKHQLASVEVGTVLADLLEVAADPTQALHRCAVNLNKSYRTQGPIHEACKAIKAGDADTAWQVITSSPTDAVGAINQEELPANLRGALEHFVKTHWLPVLLDEELSDLEKLQAIDRFRILSPTHQGSYGIEALNYEVDRILSRHGIHASQGWYPRRSVIVRKNEYSLGVFNGDVGLTCQGEEGNYVCFQSEDGARKISTALLPEVSTAWALTIHRTQGSEYDHILLVIPPAEHSAILSRELLYTGLSRAKQSATIWCSEEDLRQTIDTTVQRASGLKDMFE